MRRRIIYEPTLSDAALLILDAAGKIFIKSFWPHPYYHTFCNHKPKQSFRNALSRLENKGLIVGERRNGKVIFNLSDNGEKLAKRLKLKLELAKKWRWDGKWRILIFDVPEKIRGKRDFLRRELIDFGFYPLQKSVWVYPYPCFDEILFIGKFFNAERFIELLTVEEMINDDKLLRCFRLQS